MSAFCPVYERCGGCALQHLDMVTYEQQKYAIAEKLVLSLKQDRSCLSDMKRGDKGQRRRVELKVRLAKGSISLGYMAKKSHDIVPITVCPIVVDAINALLPSLTACLLGLKKAGLINAVQLTSLKDGVDMVLVCKAVLPAKDVQHLKEFAMSGAVCRLAYTVDRQQMIPIHQGQATIDFEGVSVDVPYAAFLQATSAGEQAIRTVITAHSRGEKIIDLYAGCGTYSLPLTYAGKQVAAYEGNYDMVVALNNAALKQGIEARIIAHQADLFASPIPAKLLAHYDTAIINPPRNGALPQIKALAQSQIQTIIMVSCNPATFQRDAAHLLGHGYALQRLTPIDQFYMTHHLELVGVFHSQLSV
jgi:23S rRNA (uracil1939-C5)-methyltransferase